MLLIRVDLNSCLVRFHTIGVRCSDEGISDTAGAP